MISSLILSAVNAGLSMVWILAFNVYIALWTRAAATDTSKSTMDDRVGKLTAADAFQTFSGTPLPNILVAHLLVSCLGVIVGTLMVIVCLSLMREAGRFKTCDLTISGPSSRADGTCTDFDAKDEDD